MKLTNQQVAGLRRIVAKFAPGPGTSCSHAGKHTLRMKAAKLLGWKVERIGVRGCGSFWRVTDDLGHERPLPGIGEIIDLAGLTDAMGGSLSFPGPEKHIEGITCDENVWLEQGLLAVVVGEKIAARREFLAYTQDACAEASGLTRSQWADLEAGRCGMTLPTLARIAAAFGLRPRALLP
jgi:DNA-binding XRE family transcriptional regulator